MLKYQRFLNDKTRTAANAIAQKSSGGSALHLIDNRPGAVVQKKQVDALVNKQTTEKPIQKKENRTGLPDQLKSGVENLSGYSLDDVKVHYHSAKPAQLNAHAYAQGTEIHMAPGQEKHLPHEAWHVVQQKQGRVKPTMQMKGSVNVIDDMGLEREADQMGAKAIEKNTVSVQATTFPQHPKVSSYLHDRPPIQRLKISDSNSFYGRELLYNDIPLSFAQSIVNIVEAFVNIVEEENEEENKNIAFEDDKPLEFAARMYYSDTHVIKWVKITKSEFDQLKQYIQTKSSQGRREAENDAKLRGDSNPDLNPSGLQRNCGYCVISRATNYENSDKLLNAMKQANMGPGDPNQPLTLEQLKYAITLIGKKTGNIIYVPSKAELIHQVTMYFREHQVTTFVLWLPSHFTIVTAEGADDKIELMIEDPQADDRWDIAYLPDSHFSFFSVS
jgi:hypothetical protein